MNNKQTKLDLISALYNRGEYFKQVNDVEYRVRCPYCGDSERENTGHLYLRINPEDNLPVVFHCFRCEEQGILRSETLSLLDINDIRLKSNIYSMNKTSDKFDGKNLVTENKLITFDYHLTDIHYGEKTKYIENRLGKKLKEEDFINMKLITSFREFLIDNNIKKLMCPDKVARRIEDHFIGFLTFGNSHILFRDITNNDEFRWIKYPITKESKDNRLFYSMASEIDILTKENLVINLAEGVFDTLSVCHNLGYNNSNTMNISVSGKYYDRLLLYLIDLGLVGSNITINIFSDNDAKFNKKGNVVETNLNYYEKLLENYKYLYNKVNVFYNTIGKDVGVPRDKICLKKYQL